MARGFKFRFETMLKLRGQREDHHKRIVGQRLRQIAEARDEIVRTQQQIAQEVEAIRRLQSAGTFDVQLAMSHRNWLTRLHRANLEATGRLGALEARLVQERAALAEAAKQRRILEKLRELQEDRHRRGVEHREVLAADDLTTMRYVHDGLEIEQAATGAGEPRG